MRNLKLLTLLWLLCYCLNTNAQTPFCGFDSMMQEIMIEDTAGFFMAKTSHAAAVAHYRRHNPGTNYLPSPEECETCLVMDSACPKAHYLLPIVVHIIHLPGDTLGQGSNISDAQVEHQIEVLNEIYRNQAGLNSVNTGIQFCLAKVKPDSSAFSGINRLASDSSNMHRQNPDELRDLIHYPTDRYINIYVVNNMLDANNNPINVAGFASYPYFGSRAKDLIVIRADMFGDYNVFNSLNNLSRGKTLVHEMGHYLGLYHPFEDGCAGTDTSDCAAKGDLCCDVPPVAAGVPGSCGPANTCTETPWDSVDQKENHMDYGYDSCRTRFTPDQADVMYTTLNGVRSRLWQPDNINGLSLACCVNAIAFSGQTDVCSGTGDSIYVRAYDYDSTNYTWYLFKSGSPYDTINRGFDHTLALLPDTGLYDLELVMARAGELISRRVNSAFEVLACDSLFSSTRGSWYFGEHAGIRFYKNGLVLRDLGPYYNQSPTQINASEGTVSMCDAWGNLLFYGGSDDVYNGDQLRIFDRQYKEMQGSPVTGNHTASQGVVSCRVPGEQEKYYVFHHSFYVDPSSSGILYSIIDLSQTATTRGEIITTDVSLKDSNDQLILYTYEGITLIPGCDSTFNWLIIPTNKNGHPQDSVYLTVFRVTGSSVTWFSDHWLEHTQEPQSTIVASPNGNYLSVGNYLFGFDRSDAGFEEIARDTSDYLQGNIGCTFSPNSQFLYRIDWNFNKFLPFAEQHYYNLSQTRVTDAQPFTTKKIVRPIDYHRQMKIGPDNKIYLTALEQNYVSVIDSPDLAYVSGNNIGYREEGVSLSKNGVGGTCLLGFPNHVDARAATDIEADFDHRIMNCNQVKFISNRPCATSYKWYFTQSDSSLEKNPEFTFSSKGNLLVTLIAGTDTVTKEIYIGIDSSYLEISGNHIVCDTSAVYDYSLAYSPDISYNWQVDSGNLLYADMNFAQIKWNGNGKARVYVTENRSQCQDSAQLNISISAYTISHDSIGSDQSVCSVEEIDTLSGEDYQEPTHYTWFKCEYGTSWEAIVNSNSSWYAPSTFDTSTAYYRLATQNAGCLRIFSDTVLISLADSSFDTISSDQFLCIASDADTLFGTQYDTAYSYTWYMRQAGDTLWTEITDAEHYFYLPDGTDTSTQYIRRALNGPGCGKFSNAVTLRLDPVNNTLSSHSPTSGDCLYGANGSAVTLTLDSLSYQWQLKEYRAAGMYSDWYTQPQDTNQNLRMIPRPDRIQYKARRIVAYNHCFDTSEQVYVNIPQFTGPPLPDQGVCVDSVSGTAVYFTVQGNFPTPTHTVWERKAFDSLNWVVFADTSYTNHSYKTIVSQSNATQGDQYRIGVISHTTGCSDTVYSNAALLRADVLPPVISSSLTNASVNEGALVVYAIVASNTQNATFEWQVKAAGQGFWAPIPGENSSSISFLPTYVCQSGNRYRGIVRNNCGADTTNESLLTVYPLFPSDQYDYWMKDSWRDTAAEPNTFYHDTTATQDLFRSPDIWNCDSLNNCLVHENAEYHAQAPNYVRVKVRNKGPNTTNSNILRVYWTLGSTGEIWERSWVSSDQNRFYNEMDDAFYPQGAEITGSGGYAIPQISPGDSTIITIPWYPPNPAWYYTKENGQFVYSDRVTLCLYSRIESCQEYPYGMTYPEQYGVVITDNTRKNNNIATLNFESFDRLDGEMVRTPGIGVGGEQDVSSNVTLHFKPAHPDHFDHWDIDMVLDDSLWKYWQLGGSQGSGFDSVGPGKLRVQGSEPFYLENIIIPPAVFPSVRFEFTSLDSGSLPTEEFEFYLSRHDPETDAHLGGFIINLDNSSGSMNDPGSQMMSATSLHTPDNAVSVFNWKIYPNPAQTQLHIEYHTGNPEPVDFKIYDIQGRNVLDRVSTPSSAGSGHELIDLDTLRTGVYFVQFNNSINRETKVMIINNR